MRAEDWTTKPGEEPIDFSAVRGEEKLFVRVVDWQPKDDNPALVYVMLEVRLGPDEQPADSRG